MTTFVDIHSHVVPSGDDGVFTVDEGLALIGDAHAHGTRRLYATPHVWPIDGLSDTRDARVRQAFSEMRPKAAELGVELELGYELTPAEARLEEDPARYRLGELDAILIEVPFARKVEITLSVAEHADDAGLTPIVAHPERSYGVHDDETMVDVMKERGWLIQVNGSSLLGHHGRVERELGWSLLERGLVDLVASDGHRRSRPPFLDEAHSAARRRLGAEADRLFDGSALAALAPTLTR